MNYKRNEDMLCDEHRFRGGQNAVIDVIYPQESGETTEIIPREEVKNFCKIEDIDEDDQLIDELQHAAIEICEKVTNVGFRKRDVVAILNNVNGGSFLPYGPIHEIQSVSYDDQAPTDDYNVQGVQWKQLITAWPRVTIEYSDGYENLPYKLKLALLQCIFYLYDERKRRENPFPPIYLETLKPFSRND